MGRVNVIEKENGREKKVIIEGGERKKEEKKWRQSKER